MHVRKNAILRTKNKDLAYSSKQGLTLVGGPPVLKPNELPDGTRFNYTIFNLYYKILCYRMVKYFM